MLRLKQAFFEAGAAVQRSSAASAATYRADLHRMVAERELSLREAIGLEIDYTARRSAEERARLTNALANDAAGLGEKARPMPNWSGSANGMRRKSRRISGVWPRPPAAKPIALRSLPARL